MASGAFSKFISNDDKKLRIHRSIRDEVVSIFVEKIRK